MKRCFGYIRISTVKQGDGVSLEAQRDAIEGYAKRNQIIITKWFEETETAAKMGRQVFNRMIHELKQGKAAGIVFHRIDRSARNFTDWARIGDLSDAGYDIHFTTESLNFHSRGGRLTADIQAVIAADYIRNLRDEAMKGMEGRLKQGLYPFKAPFGYLDNGRGKPKAIDPVHGPYVKKLFELYASGNYSLWSLRKEAKAIGLRNRGCKPLAKTAIEKILRNPFYMGVMKVQRTGKVYPGIHEPLITPGLFDQVTAVRTGRDNKKITKHQHRYRGLFRCGCCNLAMIPELQKGWVYYRCHQKECPTRSVREDRIEEKVTAFLRKYSLNRKQVGELRKQFRQFMDKRYDGGGQQQAELEMSRLDGRLSALEDKWLDGKIDDSDYERKKGDIIFKRHRWADKIKRTLKKADMTKRLEGFLELVKNLYSAYVYAAAEQKREIVEFATSNRFIYQEKLVLEPSKWMQAFERMLNLEYCDPSRDTSRTFSALEELLESLNEEEIERLSENLGSLIKGK